MTYRAAPVTQRDGSSLANSNCRMASIATGIDFETAGAQISSGKAMRSRQSDQSGGTDSGDAAQAWASYGEDLRVRDGYAFTDALEDLRAGRLVHLDVWHASVSGAGICHSGTGAYGHTIAVAPEQNGGSWLVADPWCSPPKWGWVTEAELRAGAEEWGGRVYSRALEEPDYPTGGPGPRDPRVLLIVARIVQRFMSASYPGHEAPLPGRDTGGGGAILYTTTAAQEDDDMVKWTPGADVAGTLTVIRDTAGIPIEGGDRPAIKAGISRPALGLFTLDDLDDRPCYLMGVGDQLCFVAVADVSFIPDDGPGGGGGGNDARDAEWREWLLAGSPGSE